MIIIRSLNNSASVRCSEDLIVLVPNKPLRISKTSSSDPDLFAINLQTQDFDLVQFDPVSAEEWSSLDSLRDWSQLNQQILALKSELNQQNNEEDARVAQSRQLDAQSNGTSTSYPAGFRLLRRARWLVGVAELIEEFLAGRRVNSGNPPLELEGTPGDVLEPLRDRGLPGRYPVGLQLLLGRFYELWVPRRLAEALQRQESLGLKSSWLPVSRAILQLCEEGVFEEGEGQGDMVLLKWDAGRKAVWGGRRRGDSITV